MSDNQHNMNITTGKSHNLQYIIMVHYNLMLTASSTLINVNTL